MSLNRLNKRLQRAYLFLLVSLISSNIAIGQAITWTDISSSNNMPSGVKLMQGRRQSPVLQIWAIDVDLNNPNIVVRPYLESSAIVPTQVAKTGSIIAINGGYFSGGTSVSTVVYPSEVRAQNPPSLARNGLNYPVMRSMFSLNSKLVPSVDWIYHFSSSIEDLYSFTKPLQYVSNDPSPLPSPLKSQGKQMEEILVGIGGGPILVKNGQVNVTYDEEIMWGSGVGLNNQDPRTGVGYTADNHIIMIVADGRQTISQGVGLTELASIFIDFKCVGAMNLDGGGSSGMAVKNKYVSSPSENRPVTSILAVTFRDSLKIPKVPIYEEIIDTESDKATKIGGWSESANSGFFGVSRSLIAGKGNGNNQYKYRFTPPKDTFSEVFGWWVAAGNRAKDTPYIIKHKYGTTTVKADQSAKGSAWNSLGKFVFKGDGTDEITISNEATIGDFIVADAVRMVSFGEKDPETSTSIIDEYKNQISISPSPASNFLNLKIKVTKNQSSSLKVFALNAALMQEYILPSLSEGSNEIKVDIQDLNSGIYFYQTILDGKLHSGRMVVVK